MLLEIYAKNIDKIGKTAIRNLSFWSVPHIPVFLNYISSEF